MPCHPPTHNFRPFGGVVVGVVVLTNYVRPVRRIPSLIGLSQVDVVPPLEAETRVNNILYKTMISPLVGLQMQKLFPTFNYLLFNYLLPLNILFPILFLSTVIITITTIFFCVGI